MFTLDPEATQIHDIRMKRDIFISSPDIKRVLLSRAKKEQTNCMRLRAKRDQMCFQCVSCLQSSTSLV